MGMLGLALGACRDPAPTPAPPSASVAATAAPTPSASAASRACEPVPEYVATPPQTERDAIFTLLAFAIASKSWQERGPERRGHNIAAVLVDPSHRPVCWARNAIDAVGSSAAHAEVRLLTNYLEQSEHRLVKGHRLYSTLEPCAMCAGMITLTGVYAAVFGERAGGSGAAFERLQLDSTSIGGHCPYPWPAHAVPAPVPIRRELEHAHRDVPRFHDTPEAKRLFAKAATRFSEFAPEHEENRPVLEAARRMLEAIPEGYVAIPYDIACPPKPDERVAP